MREKEGKRERKRERERERERERKKVPSISSAKGEAFRCYVTIPNHYAPAMLDYRSKAYGIWIWTKEPDHERLYTYKEIIKSAIKSINAS